MNQKLLHTPDGLRDIYKEECECKLSIEESLGKILHRYGYRDIETPTLEYFDVFGSDVGTIPARQLYKFFDQDGNTLVLRPDFTPSIARAASKFLLGSDPVRVCYTGNTFVNQATLQGRLSENTQMGAELMGDGSPEADAEIIAMVVESLLAVGLKDFQITVGHVGFFEGLAESAELEEELATELRELIRNRNSYGIKTRLADVELDEKTKELFTKMPNLFGGKEILDQAQEMVTAPNCLDAIDRLREVMEILKIYDLDRYVTIDLGMTSPYRYYTGVIFRGYTYGTGEAVVKGGRYDSLLKTFGKDAPSIGFVVVVDQMLEALKRQKISILPQQGRYLIVYRKASREDAIRMAMDYRRQGRNAELLLVEDGKQPEADNDYIKRGGYISVLKAGDFS